MDLKDAQEIRADFKEWDKEYRGRYLKCPFCFDRIMDVCEVTGSFGDEHEGGRCANCGAVFIYDRTGRLLGEAFMDAIAMAYDWDYDKALAGADGGYEETAVQYDTRAGKYLLGDGGPMNRNPKYYFVRRLVQPGRQEGENEV
jgi:hypothetical protein